jgi:hypothetical protein
MKLLESMLRLSYQSRIEDAEVEEVIALDENVVCPVESLKEKRFSLNNLIATRDTWLNGRGAGRYPMARGLPWHFSWV